MLGNGDIWEASDALGDGAADRRATAWWSGAAAWVGRGCSRDLVRRLRGVPRRTYAAASGRGGDHGPPPRRAAGRATRDERPRADGDAQAHGLVPQGLPGRGRDPPAGWGWCRRSASSMPRWSGWIPTSSSRSPSWGRRVGGRARRGTRSRCQSSGSMTRRPWISISRCRDRHLRWLSGRRPTRLAARAAVGADDARPRRRGAGASPCDVPRSDRSWTGDRLVG